MRRRAILLYWALVLLPATLVSVAGVRLIRHEAQRIEGEVQSHELYTSAVEMICSAGKW